jgi:TolB-like protein/DNA-binding winged helix-turn-helix (wHTH) protein/Tfp pilus assembly protein PilF
VASTNSSPSSHILSRFGAWEASKHTGELRKFGMRIKIQDQPFQVLIMLLEKHGGIVSRDELRQSIWPSGTFVDFENGLNKAVAKLRAILNDDPANPRFIETIPRRGYRFLAPVEFVEERDHASISPATESDGKGNGKVTALPGASDWAPADEAPLEPATPNGRDRSTMEFRPAGWRWKAWIACGVIAAVIVVAVVFSLRRGKQIVTLTAPVHSIAVLPFEDVSGSSDQAYFADGMTEELIRNLRQLAALRVVSPSSVSRFKETGESLTQLGRDMGVDAVIEGRSAHAGDRVRLTVRLFSVADNDYMWAGDYSSSIRQLLGAEDEIAQTIARQIQVQLISPAKSTHQRKHIPPPAAYEAYLEGRYYYHHWGERWSLVWWKKSCNYFEQAIQLDPEYAGAYAGLAECYAAINGAGMELPEKDRVNPQKALDTARKAIQLDDAEAEGHAALGTALMNQWQWSDAYIEFSKAVSLEPNNPQMRFRLASYYRTVGNLAKAVEQATVAKQLDPVSARTSNDLGWLCFTAGDDQRAELEFKNALALEPGSVAAKRGLFEIYERQHRLSEAISALNDFLVATRHPDRARKMLEIYHKSGYGQATHYVWLQEIQDDYKENARSFYLATDYARLGDRGKALDYLEEAYAERAPQLKGLKVNPDFRTISSDTRFQAILKRLRLDNPSLAALN